MKTTKINYAALPARMVSQLSGCVFIRQHSANDHKEVNMKRRLAVILLSVLVCAAGAFAQEPSLSSTCPGNETCIDDFQSGTYAPQLIWSQWVRSFQPLSTGLLAGTWRYTNFAGVPFGPANPFNQPDVVDIGAGHFVLNDGFQTVVTSTTIYDCNQGCTQNPLHLNLSSYDRFRLHFPSGGGHLNIVVYRADGSHADYGAQIPASRSSFALDVLFSSFVSPDHFEDVTEIVLELQANVGSTALTAFSVVCGDPSGCS
jgi:hypothetical protein